MTVPTSEYIHVHWRFGEVYCCRVLLPTGLKKNFVNGKTETVMSAMAVRVEPYCGYSDAVVVEVSGHGYYTGEATFIVEEDDPLTNGFIIN